MKQYDHVIIGFGKGGKTLAGALASKGDSVALLEQSERMFGGTCINVACIPTKFLENSARLSNAVGGDFEARSARYRSAVAKKRTLTAALREKNYQKALAAGVEVLVGKASFLDEHRIALLTADGTTQELYGERIYLNTGSVPFLPPIPGLSESRHAYTSESMIELDDLPAELLIIGAGYIGLEFASFYANFGSRVTILQDGPDFIPREDREVAQQVLDSFSSRGIRLLSSVSVLSISDRDDGVAVTIRTPTGEETLYANAALVATGRRPNIQALHPERAGIRLTERGAVAVNEHLQTSVPHIWAMGDVAGGLQFTYISLDDSRIVKSQLLGDGSRTTGNRGNVPYSVFIDPPLSRVGMTEEQAAAAGYSVKVFRLSAAAIPKAKVLGQPTGLLKAVVDADTGRILGAHLFCAESHELIGLLKLMVDQQLPYSLLRDGIFSHPTMSEALNDLFAG